MRHRELFLAVWWAASVFAVVMVRRAAGAVLRRLAAVERTPTSAIAEAPREGTVEIIGRVVRSERGLVQSTVTARPAVYARTLVERVNGSSRETVLDDLATHPFLVDDGSGATAWVEIDERAHIEVEPSKLAGDDDESTRISALLVAHDIMDSPKKLVWQEWVIEEGANLYVLGDASSMSAGPAQTQYRDAPAQRLRISPPPRLSGREMIVSTYGERELVVRLKSQQIMLRFASVIILLTALGATLFLAMGTSH